MMQKILLLEDEFQTRRNIEKSLESLGYSVYSTPNPTSFYLMAKDGNFNLWLMDRHIEQPPNKPVDSLDILKKLRQEENETPAIILTGVAIYENDPAESDGLNYAEEYIVKGRPQALKKRIAKVLAAHTPRDEEFFVIGRWHFHMFVKSVAFEETKILGITDREFDLLVHMLKSIEPDCTQSRIFTRDEIYDFEGVVKNKPSPEVRNLDLVNTVISRLRKRFHEAGRADPIKTVRGKGYRIEL